MGRWVGQQLSEMFLAGMFESYGCLGGLTLCPLPSGTPKPKQLALSVFGTRQNSTALTILAATVLMLRLGWWC